MDMRNVTYQDFAAAWKGLRSTHDVRVREVACVNAPRTLLCVEYGDHTLPAVALSAGVHGDELAGPLALFRLVAADALPRAFSYRIWPVLNPTGFDGRTRANADGVDVNRTFGRGGSAPESRAVVTANRDLKFVLSIDLHEDADAWGFYCYEYGGGSIGTQVVRKLGAEGVPIDPLTSLDLGGPLLDAAVHREPGRVTADPFREAAALEGLSYSLVLARNASQRTLTFETPQRLGLEERIAIHERAVLYALDSGVIHK